MAAAHSFRKRFAKVGILIPLHEKIAENRVDQSVCNFKQLYLELFNRFDVQVNMGVGPLF